MNKFMKEKQHEQQEGNILLSFLNLKMIRIMWLSLFLFVVNMAMAFSATATTYSQSTKLTVNLKDATVREVMEAIEEQIEFLFLYQEGQVDLNRRVSIYAKGKQLQEILDEVFKGTDNIYIVSDRLVVIGKAPRKALEVQLSALQKDLKTVIQQPQQKEIRGKVTDTSGEPLPGATVMVKGTTIGIVTDADGNFILRIPSDAQTLQVSFVGMKTQEIPIAGRATFNVQLEEETIGLEEVVAIGYGVIKKTDLTGAVGSVDAKAIIGKGSQQVLEALQGQVPGVDISSISGRADSRFSIQIRGQNSLVEGDPLYVVDGIVVNDISYLNPYDIDRIDVLKDASSTAIYGSRGSNGVVQITTKKQAQLKESEMAVSYDGSYGIKQIARLPDFMDGEEFWHFRLASYVKGKTDLNTNKTEFSISEKDAYSAIVSPYVLQRVQNNDYFDWIDAVFKNSAQQNHMVHITGNSKNTSYGVSLGYRLDQGSFEEDRMDRFNIRSQFNSKIGNIAMVGAQVNMSFTDHDAGSRDVVKNALLMNPMIHAYDEDGNLVNQPGTPSALRIPPGGNSMTSKFNPLVDIKNTIDNSRQYNILTNIYGELTPVKGLVLKTQFSPNLEIARRGEYYGLYTDKRFETGSDQAILDKSERMEYTWDNSITYTGKAEDHTYDGTFIFSVYENRSEDSFTDVQDLSVPGFYNLGSASVINATGSSFIKSTMLSFIARFNYSYNGKYLLTVSNRWDGSSKLVKKWESFPSIAAGWRISEEEFIKDKVNWVDNLKLRVSYGYSGNNNVSAYATQALANQKTWYGFGKSDTKLALGMGPGGISNYALTWEKTHETNVGIDFGFFRGRISGTIDYYDKLSDRLLMDRKLPVESGIRNAEIIDNVGSVSNKGIEVGLTTTNIKTKNVLWSTTITYSRNKNKIVSLYGGKEDDLGNKWFIGHPVEVAYQYVYDGVINAEEALSKWAKDNKLSEGMATVKDISGPNGVPDGLITPLDRTFTGSPFPKWIGSLNSTLAIKNIDFSFNIYVNQGRYVASSFYENNMSVVGRQKYKLDFDYYVPENINISPLPTGPGFPENTVFELTPNTDASLPRPNVPGPYYDTENDDFQNGWADASFVKVKNITLGYTFPKTIIEKMKMTNLRMYVNVLNPFVFSHYKGYDPEWADASFKDDGPAMITWQFGLNIKF
jgi:TonB-linked SusC/RagA family outer membrane protein